MAIEYKNSKTRIKILVYFTKGHGKILRKFQIFT